MCTKGVYKMCVRNGYVALPGTAASVRPRETEHVGRTCRPGMPAGRLEAAKGARKVEIYV